MINEANGEEENHRFLIENMEAFSAAKERQEKSWIPNKVTVAEAEATMKKARVSVRARSESPMVSQLKFRPTVYICLNLTLLCEVPIYATVK